MKERDCVECLARRLAAQKMGLIHDRFGERLPEELWSQCESKAKEILGVK
jgi:hypothetical protein